MKEKEYKEKCKKKQWIKAEMQKNAEKMRLRKVAMDEE